MNDTIDFVMPSLGPDMDEGRITEWLVRPGDHVERGQIVVVVETEKSDIDVEVFEPGTVAELLVPEGRTVDVGVPIARIRPDVSSGSPEEPAPVRPPPDDRTSTIRRQIAATMTRAWREIPHYHVIRRLDLATTLTRLETINRSVPLTDRIVPAALLFCATARAAVAVPECNGWWRGDRFEPADRVDLGVVVSLRTGGIVVPVVRDATGLSPIEMMRTITALVDEARSGRLRSIHVGEPSITVTNLGDRGADAVLGVVHAPQVALVGFGAVRPEVVVDETGAPAVRSISTAVLSGDHRATDGLTGSRFLEHLQTALDRISLDTEAGST